MRPAVFDPAFGDYCAQGEYVGLAFLSCASTDAAGRFTFTGILPGIYTMKVRAANDTTPIFQSPFKFASWKTSPEAECCIDGLPCPFIAARQQVCVCPEREAGVSMP